MNDIFYTIALLSLICATFSFIFYNFSSKRQSFAIGTISSLVAGMSLTGHIATELSHGFSGTQLISSPSFYSVIILVTYFIAQWRLRIRGLGSFLLPIALLTCLLAPFSHGTNLLDNATLQSDVFLSIHVIALILSFTVFFLCFALSIYYIIKLRAIKSHKSSAINDELPSLTRLQNAMVLTFKASWALMTVGVVFALLRSLKLDAGIDWGYAKITWGLCGWTFETVLFFLYSFNHLSTRNLARAITFVFIILLSLYSFIIITNPQQDGKAANNRVEASSL